MSLPSPVGTGEILWLGVKGRIRSRGGGLVVDAGGVIGGAIAMERPAGAGELARDGIESGGRTQPFGALARVLGLEGVVGVAAAQVGLGTQIQEPPQLGIPLFAEGAPTPARAGVAHAHIQAE